MSLHSKNLAVSAGVPAEYVEAAIRYMREKNSFTKDTAQEFADFCLEAKVTRK